MLVCHRKYISDDLKHVVLANVKTGMSYRQISKVTGLSVGAVAGIVKVCVAYILGWVGKVMSVCLCVLVCHDADKNPISYQ